jgi:hypothetical protein
MPSITIFCIRRISSYSTGCGKKIPTRSQETFLLVPREKFFFIEKIGLKTKKKLSHGGPKEKFPWERVGIFLNTL